MVWADASISYCDFYNTEVNTWRIPMAPFVKGEPRNVWFIASQKQVNKKSSKNGTDQYAVCTATYPIHMQLLYRELICHTIISISCKALNLIILYVSIYIFISLTRQLPVVASTNTYQKSESEEFFLPCRFSHTNNLSRWVGAQAVII